MSMSYFTPIFQWRCVVRLVVNKSIWSYSLVINLFVYVFVCLFVCLFRWTLLIYSSFNLRQEREQAIREFLNEPARKISRYVKPAFSNFLIVSGVSELKHVWSCSPLTPIYKGLGCSSEMKRTPEVLRSCFVGVASISFHPQEEPISEATHLLSFCSIQYPKKVPQNLKLLLWPFWGCTP